MEWLSFLGSILGGLIGGIFTFLGVKITINNENKKILEKKREEKIKNKPRLEIVNKTEIKNYSAKSKSKNELDVVVLKILNYDNNGSRPNFYYDEEALNKENLCYKEYTFKNTGAAEIDYVCITTNLPKDTALFEFENYEFFVKERLLNYEAWSNKHFIKQGDKITVRLYYLKDKIILSNIGSATITLWLRDINGNIWYQPLFIQNDFIDKSYESNNKEFKESRDIETALECFEKPYLW